MSRLVTFGWRLTQSQYLESSDPKSTYYSKLAWPYILADKLNLECYNAGINGSSAKKIWHTIANFKFQKDDLVVILWRHKNRWCIIENEKKTVNFNPAMVDIRELTKNFYSHFYNEYDIMEMYSLFVDHSLRIIADKGLKVYNLKASDLEYDLKYSNISFLKTDMKKIRKEYPLALDNHHPGKEAHAEFARQLYNEILDLENT